MWKHLTIAQKLRGRDWGRRITHSKPAWSSQARYIERLSPKSKSSQNSNNR